MQNNTIIALGHNEACYVFTAMGISSKIVTHQNLEEIVLEYIKNGIKIFFISQEFNEKVKEIKEKYKDSAYPIFLTLAMDKGTDSIGVNEIRRNVEKATGISLF